MLAAGKVYTVTTDSLIAQVQVEDNCEVADTRRVAPLRTLFRML